METSAVIICVLFAALAVSYAWGMRGLVIGGEKGAMLPGMYLGLILAWFAGGGIRENFWIPAAAGLMGMSFGGIEPYGDTIHMAICRSSKHFRPVRGYTGLAFKGAFWFAVAGGFIALSMSAMGGKYSAAEIVLFCVLIPVVQLIGYNIFNRPYDKENNKFPAIYFSFESREEWGSNAAIIIEMLVLGTVKHDQLLISLVSAGFASGFIGWLIAIKLYDYTQNPMKNGKYLFDKLKKANRIDGWKVMEFSLGAAGGLGTSLIFCLSGKEINEINAAIAANGVFNPIAKAEPFMPVVIALCAAAIILINVFDYVCDRNGKEYNSFISDCIERPFFNVIPMVFVLLGSAYAARLMTVFMLVFVCAVKNVFDRFSKKKFLVVPAIILAALSIGIFVFDIIKGGYSPFELIFWGGAPYIAAELWYRFSLSDKSSGKTCGKLFFETSYPTVLIFMMIQVTLIYIISAIIFIK